MEFYEIDATWQKAGDKPSIQSLMAAHSGARSKVLACKLRVKVAREALAEAEEAAEAAETALRKRVGLDGGF